jgi:hypothetical protein
MTRRAFLLAPMALALAEDKGLVPGYRLLYLLRFTDARAIFLEWQRSHPSDPMGFVSEAASHLFEEFERHGVLTVEFFLDDDRLLGGIKGTADPARTKAFVRANDKARSIAEGQRDANALLALTLASGMQADYLNLIAKRQIESLKQMRAAESYAQRLLAIAPMMTDAYMALGASDYIVACLPVYKRAVLWFGNIQGDKQRGMDELAQAARSGVYLGPYAKIMLALAMVREKRVKEAQGLMHELSTAFPDSPLFSRERVKIDRLV